MRVRVCTYSADRQKSVRRTAADQPTDPVARPTGGETGHRAGRRRAARDPAAARGPVRVLPPAETRVEQAARLPQARPAGHLAIR